MLTAQEPRAKGSDLPPLHLAAQAHRYRWDGERRFPTVTRLFWGTGRTARPSDSAQLDLPFLAAAGQPSCKQFASQRGATCG